MDIRKIRKLIELLKEDSEKIISLFINGIMNKILNNQNYIEDLNNLGSAIFDQYYSGKRQTFVQSHNMADTPLSSDAEQVLAALKKLDKKEQKVVVQKLEKGGNLF